MHIDVTLGGTRTPIERSVFIALLENSIASTYVDCDRALQKGSITFSDLVGLARHGDIPYSLFFAPLPLVQAQVKTKTNILLEGQTKDTFSVNSRERVALRDIELILTDFLRKQEVLKTHDPTLTRNTIVGLLRRPGKSIAADASKLSDALGLAPGDIRSCRTKEAALDLLIARLEANQVLVSQSVNNFMPQQIRDVKFSGLTVKDTKIPYIFLTGGDHGDYQEPAGRRVFTLTLLSVLIARRSRTHSPNSQRPSHAIPQATVPRPIQVGHVDFS